MNISEIYPKLLLFSDTEISTSNPSLNVEYVKLYLICFTFSLSLQIAFGDVWKDSLTELSGGQRSLVALSLILALLLFKPAPLYILDEVDAALDLSHTQNIGQMLRTHFQHSQFIVVSLKVGSNDYISAVHIYSYTYKCCFSMPVRSQFMPHLDPRPPSTCASVQSFEEVSHRHRVDHMSPGVRIVRTIGPASRCLVLRACHTRPVNCRLLCGPGFRFMSPEASSLISNHSEDAQG